MADLDSSVLRKMAARRAETVVDTDIQVARAWRQAVPKAAQDDCGLILSVDDVSGDTVTPAEAGADIADRSLLCLLEGRGDATGLLVMDPAFFGAFVGFRMTRKVQVPGAARPPTRVDARLASDLVTAILRQFGAALGDAAGEMAASMRYSGFLADARLAQFALPDAPMTRARLSVQMGPDRVAAGMQVLMPPLPDNATPPAKPARPPADWAAALGENVYGAPMTLAAQLPPLHLPLAQLLALRVGQKLTLSGTCLDHVALRSTDGRTILAGRLGRAAGDRAVRVHRSVASEVAPQPAQPAAPQPVQDFPLTTG